MKKKIYVIGHRNPDTDSVAAATSYAALKQAQGVTNCYAARAGNLNPQTEYIYDRFKVTPPEYLPDLLPKAGYYLRDEQRTVGEKTSLWEALDLMERENLRVLPIVDELGVYKSVLHYRGFARYIITRINPRKKSTFPVSIDYLVETLSAQPINVYNATEVRESPIVVAAAYNAYFLDLLKENDPRNAIVIMGDRVDLQRASIEHGVRVLILSHGMTLAPDLEELAVKNHVSVLSSPYDTTSTAMLIIYSVPVGSMGDKSVPLMHATDPISRLRGPLGDAPSRSLPIGDEDGHVVGMLHEADLFGDPNIEVIMVDHNELSQAIQGIENYRLLEVIDHHRVGNISTRYPLTFLNTPVGATCTIITNLYREQRIPMRKEIASILFCGILSDTLSLKSATTTDTDREAVDYLARVTGLNVDDMTRDMQGQLGKLAQHSAAEIIALDRKEYNEQGFKFAVSQVETTSLENMIQRKSEFTDILQSEYDKNGYLFAALLITDITKLDSVLIIAGKKEFVTSLGFPRLESDAEICLLKDVVSRKKQLIPLLTELMETLQKEGKI
jgi:manganese-dependent inorganic pyrophosphatase